ncbi:SURF5-domain-containing protein [Hesseltinella vesiculosa]|uniref:SURF5-domain-containing protein n=1 Tax=Hesseltinella vesiculosa TaxID=101127 RepID=A0A1X2GKH8_9FUNG|nr:SURF5-domain-containing protein [Hesseltinella vesiculosa]
MNTNAASTSSRPVLIHMEDQYNKRIDDDISKLVDCFTDIVKAGEIADKDKFKVSQEGYQIENQATQIVRSTESLLGLIKELKQFLLLNDTRTLTALTEYRSNALTSQTNEIKKSILDLRQELTDAIYDMESVYFRSVVDP